MPEIHVHALDVMKEARWDFESPTPYWRHDKHQYYFTAKFDPFPAYPHDKALVEDYAETVTQRCPPLWDIDLFVADREEIGRTNAWSQVKDYRDEQPPIGVIMMAGKRIPPHPGMTRHLVGHEFGHHVSWMLGKARGAKNTFDDPWVKEYLKLRGLPKLANHHGNGGTWHNSVHEIFACDFRIVVCGIETEFWPHPGIPHPREKADKLMPWWEAAVEEIRVFGKVNDAGDGLAS